MSRGSTKRKKYKYGKIVFREENIFEVRQKYNLLGSMIIIFDSIYLSEKNYL